MKETIGQKIRRLRKERGWTQEELAHRLRTAGSTVSRWETSKQTPQPMAITLLEKIFEVDLSAEGGNGFNSTRSFNGLIDEVRIYNRALTAWEIATLYEWGRG